MAADKPTPEVISSEKVVLPCNQTMRSGVSCLSLYVRAKMIQLVFLRDGFYVFKTFKTKLYGKKLTKSTVFYKRSINVQNNKCTEEQLIFETNLKS